MGNILLANPHQSILLGIDAIHCCICPSTVIARLSPRAFDSSCVTFTTADGILGG